MLKRIALLLALLPLAASCSQPAPQSQSAECTASYGLCTARDVARLGTGSPDKVLDAFIAQGAIADIVRLNAEAKLKSVGFTLDRIERFGLPASEQTLAALTLAAAARNSVDPFADAEWIATAGRFREDHEVALRATMLIKNIGYEPWESVLRQPPGLEAIWRKVVATAPADNKELLDLANYVLFDGPPHLKPLARQLIDRGANSHQIKSDQLLSIASLLASRFEDPDRAQALYDESGAEAEQQSFPSASGHTAIDNDVGNIAFDHDIDAIKTNIAEARLRNGARDEAAIALVAQDLVRHGPDLFSFRPIEALAQAKAADALLRVGDAWLARARERKADAFTAGELFAGASNAYRLAGDNNKAVAAAREGMPLIPYALDDRPDIPDLAERKRLTGEDNGMRVAPALALYNAGEEREALASGYVSGLDLLQQWQRPLNEFDPYWIADGSPKWLSVVLSEVIDRNDLEFAGRMYDAIARTMKQAEPSDLAALAAAAGKSDQAWLHIEDIRALAADTSRHPSDKTHFLLQSVRVWKVVEILLARQRS